MTAQQNTARDINHGPSADELWDAADALHRQYAAAVKRERCPTCGEPWEQSTDEAEELWTQYDAMLRRWIAAYEETR